MGYHLKDIPQGKIGEFSKIIEEFEELKDAYEQDNRLMMLIELSDLYGAIESYLEQYNLNMVDLKNMSKATKRAFQSGVRKPK